MFRCRPGCWIQKWKVDIFFFMWNLMFYLPTTQIIFPCCIVFLMLFCLALQLLQEWSRFSRASASCCCWNMLWFWSHCGSGTITLEIVPQPVVLCCSFWSGTSNSENTTTNKVSFNYTEQCGKHGHNCSSSGGWTIHVECTVVLCCSANCSRDSSPCKLIANGS